MNRSRLLKLADLLEEDAGNRKGVKFDITSWGTVGKPNKPISCDTTACAMGLAAISGAFSDDGLDYRLNPDGYIQIGFKGDPCGGFHAAEYLFDIDIDTADWLFDYPGYPEGAKLTGAAGERVVAQRIRDLVDGKATP